MINWGDIEGRLDPFYYKIEYRMLEKTIQNKSKFKLRDFIIYMAGGATPNKEEHEKYYADSSGIPFVRVQNLTPEGLNLDECVYINEYTHNNMLYRSRVEENNLLVKITGVGRMAVSSVAPHSFIGNINQHIVVIKTKDRQTSELIAAYLNSDIGEKLASRRSTGGTRPALDYTALRSIPIIVNPCILEIMNSAYLEKQTKKQKANELLGSIEGYLLSKLKIKITEFDDSALEERIFPVESVKVIGGRFDPKKYSKKHQYLFNAIENAAFVKMRLRDMIKSSISGNWGVDESFDDESLIKCLTVRGTEFDNRYNLLLDNNRAKYRKYSPELFDKIKLRSNDILIEKSGGSENQPVGRVAFIDSELEKESLAYSNFLQKIRIDEEIAIPEYVFEYLKLMHNIKVTEVMQTQTNGIRNLILKEYFNQTIILPDIDIQKEIVAHIRDIREQAKRLEEEAENIVKDAKKQVEEILLGDVL